MKVFISGLAGFLGSHIADAWLANGGQVVGCDNLSTGDIANVPSGAVMFKLDCRDQYAMRGVMLGCDVVYHTAALAHEGLSVFSPHLICDNVLGASASVFGAAISVGVRRIVHMSSMSRYGTGDPPFREDDEPRPEDPYGIAKLASEDVLRSLARAHGTEHVIAVPHNIIGVRQAYTDPYRNVASIFINRMLQGKPPIIYGNGSQVRCFSPVADMLPGLVMMGENDDLDGETINIGPDGGEMTILDLATTLAEIIGFKGQPTFLPSRPLEVHTATCSSDKARALLDYRPTANVRDTLVAMVEDIRAKGPKPFKYGLKVEIESELTPKTWSQRIM